MSTSKSPRRRISLVAAMDLRRFSMPFTIWAIQSARPRRSRGALDPKGTFMIVEPLAGDSLAENLNPVGRVYYGFSTMVCTPTSLSQEVGLALGAQAGEKRLKAVLSEAGFTGCGGRRRRPST